MVFAFVIFLPVEHILFVSSDAAKVGEAEEGGEGRRHSMVSSLRNVVGLSMSKQYISIDTFRFHLMFLDALTLFTLFLVRAIGSVVVAARGSSHKS